MYLILLKPDQNYQPGSTYTSVFSDNLLDVAQAFRDHRGIVKVFKLDSLTEITEVEIEVLEKPKELS